MIERDNDTIKFNQKVTSLIENQAEKFFQEEFLIAVSKKIMGVEIVELSPGDGK